MAAQSSAFMRLRRALDRGNAISSVTASNLATPFDPELRDEVVAAVAARISE